MRTPRTDAADFVRAQDGRKTSGDLGWRKAAGSRLARSGSDVAVTFGTGPTFLGRRWRGQVPILGRYRPKCVSPVGNECPHWTTVPGHDTYLRTFDTQMSIVTSRAWTVVVDRMRGQNLDLTLNWENKFRDLLCLYLSFRITGELEKISVEWI